MNIKIFKSHKLSSKAAALEVIKLVKSKTNAVLGLATGSSPEIIYEELINDHKLNHTSYKEITTFNLDEYIGLTKDNKCSYHYYMNEKLFKNLDIIKTNLPLGTGDIKTNIKNYNDKLNNNYIDLQILGIGTNGHIAFNEPGTKEESITRRVNLTEDTINSNKRYFNSLDMVPKEAITMGISNILKSGRIILIANGKNKAQAIKNMIEGPISSQCPASFLQKHSNVKIYLDEDAASLLK